MTYEKPPVNREEILAGLTLTGYFLDHWLLSPHNRKLPAARQRLIDSLSYGILKKSKETA